MRAVLHRRCRSFVIYLLLSQQTLVAIFLPRSPPGTLLFLSYFPPAALPTSALRPFDLVISLTLLLHQAVDPETRIHCFIQYLWFSFLRRINSNQRPLTTDVNLHLASFVLSSLFLLFFLGEMIYLMQGQGHLPISKYH